MNHVLDVEGYRFFQASYDQDEQGSILSVSYDQVGCTITYIGYALLFLGLLVSFFSPQSRFVRTKERLKKLSNLKVLAIFIGLGFFSMVCASPISEHHIQMFKQVPIQSANGRIVPMSTFARNVGYKLKLDNDSDLDTE